MTSFQTAISVVHHEIALCGIALNHTQVEVKKSRVRRFAIGALSCSCRPRPLRTIMLGLYRTIQIDQALGAIPRIVSVQVHSLTSTS